MKIWIIDHYSSEPKYGGISRQYDFLKEFSKRGHEVLVISSSFSHYTHSFISNKSCFCSDVDERAHYAYVRTTPYKKNNGIKRIINTISFVIKVRIHYKELVNMYGSPDIVVGSSVHPFTWIIANYIAKKRKARFFAEVRDLWPENQINDEGMSPYHPMAIILGWLEKWAYSNAEKIIYTIPKGDEYICDKLGYSRDKVCWIPQPMDCERFDCNKKRYSELDNALKQFIGEDFLCAFAGYYIDYEGVNVMLEAAKMIQEKGLPIKFVFVGSGPEAQNMRNYVKSNNLQNVYIGDRINKELVPALLNRADICLAHLAVRDNPKSYKYDSSKNKMSEYMYSNSCVIYGTYLKEQFVQTSGSGYIIQPFSSEQFVEKIIDVYNMDSSERLKFGINGRKYIEEYHTVEKLVDRYLALI